MNALLRDIEVGEVVVIRIDAFRDGFKGLEHRAVVCQSGFGMVHENIGNAIFVHKLGDRYKDLFRCAGWQIDKAGTEAFQSRFGKDGGNFLELRAE